MNTNSDQVIKAIFSTSGDPKIFDLEITEFREVYDFIQKEVNGTPVDIVINGDWAVIQFSRLSTHRIRIRKQTPKGLSAINFRREFRKEDFDFASLYSDFYGETVNYSFASFLLEEVSVNWFPLLLTSVFGLIFFSLLYELPNKIDTFKMLNELMLTSATLFLSVFILFTVSQNVDLVKDSYLFQKGMTHKFFRTDRYMSILVVAVISLCFINVIFINGWNPFSITLMGRDILIDFTRFNRIVPIISTLGLIILLDCFLALIRYYFRRVQLVIDKDLTKKLLDDLWKTRNKS